jgi:hypothetical protein
MWSRAHARAIRPVRCLFRAAPLFAAPGASAAHSPTHSSCVVTRLYVNESPPLEGRGSAPQPNV